MIEFKLPALGADMEQGKLLQWQVRPGDAVSRGQVIAVVDTSKAAVDVESWQEGTVFELLVQPGQTVPVGTVLATFLEAGETAKDASRGARGAATVAAPAPVPSPAAAGASARRRISPAARKHAEDHGIDIDTVVGTGLQGAVSLQDVERVAAEREARGQPEPDRHAEMRRAIAAAMSRSKREIPHYYLSESVPMRRAQQWLTATNEQRGVTGRLLMAVLQLKAVAITLKKYPDLNGFYVDGAHQRRTDIHIGVAISLRQGGLVAPAIHEVGDKTLDQLMQDLTDLVRRARAGSLRSSEMSDPTITVTNLGDAGVETVYGVIYPPQVALVGFGTMQQRAWVTDGAVDVAPVTTATLAADHRVSDGHYGASFLAELRDRLQHPEQL